MSKDRLKHSLEELFSDFAPPAPEGEAGSSSSPPPGDVRAEAGAVSQRPTPLPRDSHETLPLSEKEPLPGQEKNIGEEKDVNEDEKGNREDNSSPEDNIGTWRAGWRNLASENSNGKGRAGSAKISISNRKRRTR